MSIRPCRAPLTSLQVLMRLLQALWRLLADQYARLSRVLMKPLNINEAPKGIGATLQDLNIRLWSASISPLSALRRPFKKPLKGHQKASKRSFQSVVIAFQWPLKALKKPFEGLQNAFIMPLNVLWKVPMLFWLEFWGNDFLDGWGRRHGVEMILLPLWR